MRFKFSKKKSQWLRKHRGAGFEEAQDLWGHWYYMDKRRDVPEQYRAIGWVKGRLFTVIYEEREDSLGEYYHLVTLWKSTQGERGLYEKRS